MPTYEWRAIVTDAETGTEIKSGTFETLDPRYAVAERQMYDDLEKVGYPAEMVRQFDLEMIDYEPAEPY